MFIGPVSVMTHGCPSSKIVLNTMKISISANKSGKAYNTGMRLTFYTDFKGYGYLHRKILYTERVTILHICS